MKNTQKPLGIAAIVLVIAWGTLSLTGCGNPASSSSNSSSGGGGGSGGSNGGGGGSSGDSGGGDNTPITGGGAPGLPDNAADVSELAAFASDAVKSEYDPDDSSFKAYVATYVNATEFSAAVELNAPDKKYDWGYDGSDYVVASIVGTAEASYSSNVRIGQILGWDWYSLTDKSKWEPYEPRANDTEESSYSYDKTYKITDSNLGTNKFITGTITVSGSGSSSTTYTAQNTNITDEKFESESDSEYTGAVALTIDDGTKGAKVIFTDASEGSYVYRSLEWFGGNAASDILVYNNAGSLIFTIQQGAGNYAGTINDRLGGLKLLVGNH